MDFSESYLDYLTSTAFNNHTRELNDGGQLKLALDFLMLNGIALEKDVPYRLYSEGEYDLLKKAPIKKIVTNGFILSNSKEGPISSDDIVTMKNHIIKNGGLSVSIPSPDDGTNYYNSNSLYWNGDLSILNNDRLSHAVTIVGWDDNYSINNFKSGYQPSTPGAFIALNSWGKDFGENGYFYISYDSWYLEYEINGIIDTEDANYSNKYSHSNFITLENTYEYLPIIYDEDEYYSENRTIYESIYFANIFEKNKGIEFLNKVILLADENSSFELYVNQIDGNLNTNNYTFVKGKKSSCNGLTLIEIDKPIELTGEKFVIAVKVTGDNIGCFDLDKKNYTYVSLNLNNNWKKINNLELLEKQGNYRNIPIIAYTINK